jgi:hypothetical protein
VDWSLLFMQKNKLIEHSVVFFGTQQTLGESLARGSQGYKTPFVGIKTFVTIQVGNIQLRFNICYSSAPVRVIEFPLFRPKNCQVSERSFLGPLTPMY